MHQMKGILQFAARGAYSRDASNNSGVSMLLCGWLQSRTLHSSYFLVKLCILREAPRNACQYLCDNISVSEPSPNWPTKNNILKII